MWVKNLSEFSKGNFELSHNILNPYTAKYAFYRFLILCVSYDIFELCRHKDYWDGPWLIVDCCKYPHNMLVRKIWLSDVTHGGLYNACQQLINIGEGSDLLPGGIKTLP